MEDSSETFATKSEELLQLVSSCELALERHEACDLRYRGTLIYLAIEGEGDGQLLVRVSASVTSQNCTSLLDTASVVVKGPARRNLHLPGQ